MKTIAERVIELVNIKGGNMSEFARKIEVTPAYISKLKNEPTRVPSDLVIERICREFSVNRAWLETGSGDPFQEVSRSEYLAEVFGGILAGHKSEKNAFIEAVAQLPDELFPVFVKSWIEAAERMKETLEQK